MGLVMVILMVMMMMMVMMMEVQRCLACGQVGDPRLMENKVEILSVDQKESKGDIYIFVDPYISADP